MVLVRSSEVGGDSGSGVLLKVRNAGMQGQEFLCSLLALEADLTSFLLSSGAMRLFDHIGAARCPDDLNVLHPVEYGECSNGRAVTPEFVGMDHVWHVVTHQQPFEGGVCRLGILPILQEKIQDRARVVDGPPQPEFLALDLDADFIQKPPGTPSGLPVPEFFGEERGELDVPLAQRLVADLNAALLEEFLDVTLTQRETVIEPESVLDDAERETVAVRLAVSHRRSAYRA